MGGVTIPLPALQITPFRPVDPVEQYVRLSSLLGQQRLQQQQMQGMQLENQQRQMQMQASQRQQQEAQAFRDTFSSVAQKIPNATQADLIDATTRQLSTNPNVSPQTLQQLQLHAQDLRQKTATADDATLKLRATQIDNLRGAFKPIYDLPADTPPAQLEAAYQQQRARVMQNPQAYGVADPSTIPAQFPGKQAGSFLMASMAGASRQIEETKAQREAQASEAETAFKNMQARQGGTTDIASYISNYLQAKGLPDTPANRLRAHQAYTQETKIQPAQVRVEGFGAIRQTPVFDTQTGQTTYMDSNTLNAANAQEPGRYRAPQFTPEAIGQKTTTEYFTKGKGGQQLTAFNTAIAHLSTLDRLASDLNNTDLQVANRAKQAWAEQTGNPAPVNFAAAVNAMSGEVAAALKSSGATDQEIQKAAATFDRAQSPGQLKGAISTYRELLTSKAGQLQQQYQSGMQGKPAFQQAGGQSGGPAQGYTRIQASDGSLHDLPSANLDRARQRDPGLKVVQQ